MCVVRLLYVALNPAEKLYDNVDAARGGGTNQRRHRIG
ncbi:hypothetical protein GJV44_00477 [Candidatus Vallotia cooleyia]|nr:hypothetical protein GJV44_00477 [Candidatus Vallotia cooleyia]